MTTLNISSEPIVKESEKAICIHLIGYMTTRGDYQCKGIDLWIPKSIIKNGEVPEWFFKKNDKLFFYENIGCIQGEKMISL